MKIVADKAIPFLKGVFEPYAEVLYKSGEAISPDDVRDADALITRTRTRCDADLLEGSSVKLIASATIGLDHVDLQWCRDHGIEVMNAPGCNAGGVVQYVMAAVYGLAERKAWNLGNMTMGIVGVGNVGGRLAALAEKLGFKVLRNDPPRALAEGGEQFCDLDYLLENSDIVTMHVPLQDDTIGMADERFFSKMKKGAMFINASRGEVVDEKALVGAIPGLGAVVLDTWNHEPGINAELVGMVDIGTPHIAGYSYQGKQNGTASAVRQVASCLGISCLLDFYPPTEDPAKEVEKLELAGKSQSEITALILNNYPIFTDDALFREGFGHFEDLRKGYDYRREFDLNI